MHRVQSAGTAPVPSFILPQELVCAVVDEIAAARDTHSLASVSLVSKAWYFRTRDHLFKTLTIPSAKGDEKGPRMIERCTALSDVLKGRPELVQYVKGVVVTKFDESLLSRNRWFKGWFIEVIGGLTGVRSLTLRGNPNTFFIQWKMFPRRLRVALLNLMSRASVVRLSLEYIEGFDIAVPLSYHNIQELSLYNAWPTPTRVKSRNGPLPSSLRSLGGTPHRPIRRLHIAGSCEALESLFRESRKKLRLCPESLSVDAKGWNQAMAQATSLIIQDVGHTVKEYLVEILDQDTRLPSPSHLFNFEGLPSPVALPAPP
ncbi:hypothetical protein NMY22_g9168 [Coprinellus aureogranulatus]|nr:hypothetical protein NMY22_g9168 [Coprinellus aureogranulatus]